MELNDYKSKGFMPFCLEEIRMAFRDHVDPGLIELYMNDPSFNNLQLRQIRLGLQDELDVSAYARVSMPEEEMEKIRLLLLSEKKNRDLDAEKKEKLEQEKTQGEVRRLKIHNMLGFLKALLIIVVLAVISAGVYFGKKAYDWYSQELFIEFYSDSIVLEYGEPFNPENQIKELPDIEGLAVIWPSFDSSSLGEYDVAYQIFNGFRSLKKDLHISVVDTVKPVINLNEEEITLIRGTDEFIPEIYIKEMSDSCDQEPKLEIDELDWEKDEQEIRYILTDSSGNSAEAVLKAFIIDKPKQQTFPSGNNSSRQESIGSDDSASSGNSGSDPDDSKPDPEPQPSVPETARVYCHNVTVKLGTDPGTAAYSTYDGLSGNITISIQYPELNTSMPGTYPVYYINTANGETMATAYVTVSE